jgi:hypothetical protein
VGNTRTYLNQVMAVPAATVAAAGLYRLSILLTHANLGAPTDNVCIAQGPVLQFTA